MTNKIKKKKKLMNNTIIVILILFLLSNTSYGRYYKRIEGIYVDKIAEPIVRVDKLSETITNNDYTKNCGNLEYSFSIKNYYIDESGSKKISDVSFDYEIRINESNNRFPVNYSLYDLDDGTELLNGNLTSSKKHILKNIEYFKTYKLIVFWDDEKELSGSTNNINVEVNVIQSGKGALS